mmetsp:Transcript_124303/g.214737  ORF Transcript_124303/g.214737 Transcript_124303/m.214737 type:complete len:117 (+) Transcript_124303:2561-2911(+)
MQPICVEGGTEFVGIPTTRPVEPPFKKCMGMLLGHIEYVEGVMSNLMPNAVTNANKCPHVTFGFGKNPAKASCGAGQGGKEMVIRRQMPTVVEDTNRQLRAGRHFSRMGANPILMR